MNVVPNNSCERVFTLVVILFGLVTLSSFVSTITTTMASIRKHRFEKQRTRSMLWKYFVQQSLSVELGNGILHWWLSYLRTGAKRVHEADFLFFKDLPPMLMQRLHVEVYTPVLRRHPFFARLNSVEVCFVKQVCHYACSDLLLRAGETLFNIDTEAQHMYFLQVGQLHFHTGISDARVCQAVGVYEHICEAALWLSCRHQGKAAATLGSELIAVCAADFQALASESDSCHLMRLYAQSYLERLLLRGCVSVDLSMDVSDSQGLVLGAFTVQKNGSLSSFSSIISRTRSPAASVGAR